MARLMPGSIGIETVAVCRYREATGRPRDGPVDRFGWPARGHSFRSSAAESGEAPVQCPLTVVLLTYNCGHRLDPILDRVVALGLPIVAVDNASADGTVDVLRARPASGSSVRR